MLLKEIQLKWKNLIRKKKIEKIIQINEDILTLVSLKKNIPKRQERKLMKVNREDKREEIIII
jgi:hypothetical protein